VSNPITEEVWRYSRAKPAAKLVLLAIADNANTETREAWPSPGHIAQRANCTIRHVYNQLLILEEMGELLVLEHTDFCTTYRIRQFVEESPDGRRRQLNTYPEHEQRGGNIKDPARVAAILARRPAPTPWERPAHLRRRKGGKA
jgi:hypothetical protein